MNKVSDGNEALGLSTSDECNELYELWLNYPVSCVREHPASSGLSKTAVVQDSVLDYDSDKFLYDLVHQWCIMLKGRTMSDELASEHSRLVGLFDEYDRMVVRQQEELADPNNAPQRTVRNRNNETTSVRPVAVRHAREHEELQGRIMAVFLGFIRELLYDGVTFYGVRPSEQWEHDSLYARDILGNPHRLLDYILDMLIYMEFVQKSVKHTPFMVTFTDASGVQDTFYAVEVARNILVGKYAPCHRVDFIVSMLPAFNAWWT